MKQKIHWFCSIVDRDNSENANEVEDSSIEIIQFEEKRKNKNKNNTISKLVEKFKRLNIHVVGVLEKEEKKIEAEKKNICEKIRSENFPNLKISQIHKFTNLRSQ